MINLICKNIKLALSKLSKWIDLVIQPVNQYTYFYFYSSLSNTQLNKIEITYLNWLGYILSDNPNYYWIFWELLDSSSTLYKYKLYYSIPWKEENQINLNNIFKNINIIDV